MSLAATILWEVETGGSDTNGGGFDPAQTTNMATDGAATLANTGSPVFTSASYTFVAGDVGAKLFVAAGSNWTPGWYPIASVSGGAAYLSAAVAAAVTKSTMQPNTVAGCATTASPTGATWSVDYSQQSSPRYTPGTNAATSASAVLTVPSLAGGYPNLIGNNVYSTGGGSMTGWYTVINQSSTSWTLDRAPTASTLTNATINAGGALASPGQAGGCVVASNTTYVQEGTYNITSASTNISGGCVSISNAGSASAANRLIGYNSVRGDFGTSPILKATTNISTFVIVVVSAQYTIVDNISVNGNNYTSALGIRINANNSTCVRCTATNCTNNGFNSGYEGEFLLCQATGCSTQPAFSVGTANYCVAYSNTITGFVSTGAVLTNCLSVNNTGASSYGFEATGVSNYHNCTAYGNGSHNFYLSSAVGTFYDCVSEGSLAGYGFAASASNDATRMYNCATYNNSSGPTNNISTQNQFGNITNTAATSFFANPSGGNFAPNNTAGAGALLRAAGFVGAFPNGVSTTSYADVGAVQHQDSGSSTVYVPVFSPQVVPQNMIGDI